MKSQINFTNLLSIGSPYQITLAPEPQGQARLKRKFAFEHSLYLQSVIHQLNTNIAQMSFK